MTQRWFDRTFWLATCWAPVLLCVACDAGAGGASDPGRDFPTAAEVQALGDGQLRQQWIHWQKRAATDDGAASVEAARVATSVARTLMRRTGDATYVTSAVAMVLQSTQGRGGLVACEALLERAEMLMVELKQIAQGERALRDLLVRFKTDAAAQACVARAQRAVAMLVDHPAVRAARDAMDVDADVPGREEAGATTERAGAAWIQRRAEASGDTTPGTLERLTVYGGRDGARGVRAVLYFDRPVAYRSGQALAEHGLPRRLYLDFDAVRVSPTLKPSVVIGQGGLQRVRLVDLEGGSVSAAAETPRRVRVSFDVDAAVKHQAFFLSDPYRVVIDLHAGDAVAQRPTRTIVLDPGHGGRNQGAHGPHGLREAAVALDLARRVRVLLRHELPDVRVVLTRETNVDLSLEERTAIANGVNAMLFVSIHLNAWNTSDQGGVATFVLDLSDDSQALRLAARENGTDEAGVSELQKVLATIYRKEQVTQSMRLAEAIHGQVLTQGRSVLPQLHDRGVKRALFYVLVGAAMPAVLVEPSFITHPDEAQALTSDVYREKLAAGIALGIARYAKTL